MQHKSVEFKADDVQGRTFSGYASTYERDLGNDIVLPGAFSKTLSERGNRIKALWQHSEPIGRVVNASEDSKGLFVEVKLSETPRGNEALALIKDGVIDQMSIGYAVPQGKADFSDDGTRYIKELKLFEVSAVTFPMNENAIITGVKSVKDAIQAGNLDRTSIVELKSMLEDLTALLSTEPPKGTQDATQPPELDALFKSIQNFGR